LPLRMRRTGHLRPRRLPTCHPLGHGKMLHPPRLTGRPTHLMRGRTDIRAHRVISLPVLKSPPKARTAGAGTRTRAGVSRVTCHLTLDRVSPACLETEFDVRAHQGRGWVRVARARSSYSGSTAGVSRR